MAFEKYSTDKLKKMNKVMLIVGVCGLFVMCFALGIAIYGISHNKESNLIYLIPTVFMPICFIPILFSSSISSELKKRNQKED